MKVAFGYAPLNTSTSHLLHHNIFSTSTCASYPSNRDGKT